MFYELNPHQDPRIDAIGNQIEILNYLHKNTTKEQKIKIIKKESTAIKGKVKNVELGEISEYITVSQKKPNAFKGLKVGIKELSSIAANIFLEENKDDPLTIKKFKKQYGSYFQALEKQRSLEEKLNDSVISQKVKQNIPRKKLELRRGNSLNNIYRYLKEESLGKKQTNFLGLDIQVPRMQEKAINKVLEKITTEIIKEIKVSNDFLGLIKLMEGYNYIKKKYNIHEKYPTTIPNEKMYKLFDDAMDVIEYKSSNNTRDIEKRRIENYANEFLNISKTRNIDLNLLDIIDNENIFIKEIHSLRDQYNFEIDNILENTKLLPRKKISKEAEKVFYELLLDAGVKTFRMHGYKDSLTDLKATIMMFIQESPNFTTKEKMQLRTRAESEFETDQIIYDFVVDRHDDKNRMISALKKRNEFIDPSEICENRIKYYGDQLKSFNQGTTIEEVKKSYDSLHRMKNYLKEEKYTYFDSTITNLIVENIQSTIAIYTDQPNILDYDNKVNDLINKIELIKTLGIEKEKTNSIGIDIASALTKSYRFETYGTIHGAKRPLSPPHSKSNK